MSQMSPEQARKIVEARLGRAPQDALEAAVVLEAWAGVRPATALTLGADAVVPDQSRRGPSRTTPRRPQATVEPLLSEGAALVILVVAVALWTRPFAHALGDALWDDAVRIALPLTLGLHWILRSRYLGRPKGLASLQRDWSMGLFVFVALGILAFLLGLREQVALLLIATWVTGPVIARRGWGLVYVLILVAVTVTVNAGVDPLPVLIGAAALTNLAAIIALTTAQAGHDTAGRCRQAAVAGLMGAGIGCLLIADTTIGWGTQGSLTAITLIPSTIGSFWGGVHVWRVHEELPRALTRVPVVEADRMAFRGSVMRTFTGSLARLVGATAVLSVAVLVAIPHAADTSTADGSTSTYRSAAATSTVSFGGLGEPSAALASPVGSNEASADQAGDIALLLGFGLVALATLLVGLLQSFGYSGMGLLSVFCGLVAEIGLQIWGGWGIPGVGLVVGAAVAVVLALPPSISLFLRPGRLLATTMWIR